MHMTQLKRQYPKTSCFDLYDRWKAEDAAEKNFGKVSLRQIKFYGAKS